MNSGRHHSQLAQALTQSELGGGALRRAHRNVTRRVARRPRLAGDSREIAERDTSQPRDSREIAERERERRDMARASAASPKASSASSTLPSPPQLRTSQPKLYSASKDATPLARRAHSLGSVWCAALRCSRCTSGCPPAARPASTRTATAACGGACCSCSGGRSGRGDCTDCFSSSAGRASVGGCGAARAMPRRTTTPPPRWATSARIHASRRRSCTRRAATVAAPRERSSGSCRTFLF